MDTTISALVPEGLLALPGKVKGLGSSATAGILAAGDDRGEAGVWDQTGRRLFTTRLASPVVSSDVSSDGLRQAFAGSDGEIVLVSGGGRTVTRLRAAPQPLVLCDAGTARTWVIDRASGAAELRDPSGAVAVAFQVPAPVADAVVVPRTGGLVVVTAAGVVARFGAWGKLLWGADFARSTAAIACDAAGRELWLAVLARGAEVIDASSGTRLRAIDTGRPVACVSVGARRVALGCADGMLVLADRGGSVVAEGPSQVRALDVAVLDADDDSLFALFADGTVRLVGATASPHAPAVPKAQVPATAPPRRRTSVVASAPGVSVSLGGALERSARPVLALDGTGAHAAVTAGPRDVRWISADGRVVAAGSTESPVLALRAAADGVTILSTTEIRRLAAGGNEQVVHFAVENHLAAFSPCGEFAIRADEIGALRLTRVATGADIADAALGHGRSAAVVAAWGERGAAEVRGAGVLLFGAGWQRTIPAPDGPARLCAAFADGVVLVDRRGIHAHTWDGGARWSVTQFPVPRAAFPIGGEHLAVVAGDVVVVIDRGGRVVSRFPAPEGTAVAAAGTDGWDAVVAARAGRLVTTAGARAAAAAVPFDGEVLGVALAAGGRGAAVLDGRLVWFGAGAAEGTGRGQN